MGEQTGVCIHRCNQKTPDSAEEELFLYWLVLRHLVTNQSHQRGGSRNKKMSL